MATIGRLIPLLFVATTTSGSPGTAPSPGTASLGSRTHSNARFPENGLHPDEFPGAAARTAAPYLLPENGLHPDESQHLDPPVELVRALHTYAHDIYQHLTEQVRRGTTTKGSLREEDESTPAEGSGEQKQDERTPAEGSIDWTDVIEAVKFRGWRGPPVEQDDDALLDEENSRGPPVEQDDDALLDEETSPEEHEETRRARAPRGRFRRPTTPDAGEDITSPEEEGGARQTFARGAEISNQKFRPGKKRNSWSEIFSRCACRRRLAAHKSRKNSADSQSVVRTPEATHHACRSEPETASSRVAVPAQQKPATKQFLSVAQEEAPNDASRHAAHEQQQQAPNTTDLLRSLRDAFDAKICQYVCPEKGSSLDALAYLRKYDPLLLALYSFVNEKDETGIQTIKKGTTQLRREDAPVSGYGDTGGLHNLHDYVEMWTGAPAEKNLLRPLFQTWREERLFEVDGGGRAWEERSVVVGKLHFLLSEFEEVSHSRSFSTSGF